MQETPKGLRLHIGLFGKRNAGKSSLINALTNQKISIVSNVAGTTTDPVEKACELQPIGPVVFIDTAGVDDVGELGLARVERSQSILQWVDIAIIISNIDTFDQTEIDLIDHAKQLNTPTILVFNKADQYPVSEKIRLEFEQKFQIPVTVTDANLREGVDTLRNTIIKLSSEHQSEDRLLVGDLVNSGDTVLLVTPIDTGAPKGRLILPQVQTIRELLDKHAKCFVVQQNRVKEAINDLKHPPKLIVADSQVILDVASQTPNNIPLTTFSIQMAYSKADVIEMARGTAVLANLQDGDRILILETCSHHPQKDDIGRVKIPRWLRQKTGKNLNIEICVANLQDGDRILILETCSHHPQKDDIGRVKIPRWLRQKTGKNLNIEICVGKDIPADLTPYKVLIQCGGCIVTRRHMLARLRAARKQHVPMTNYGMTISFLQGVIERVLLCHPEALQAYLTTLNQLKGESIDKGTNP